MRWTPTLWCVPVSLILVGAPSLHAQSPEQILKKALWTTAGEDLVEISTRPITDPGKTLRNAAVVLGLLLTDPWTTRLYQNHIEPIGGDLRERVEIPSLYPGLWWADGIDGYAYTAVGGLYLAGLATRKPEWQESGLLATKAILESYVVSHLFLKTIFARHRPNQPLKGGELEDPFTRDAWDFFNWHRPYFDSNADGTAFPSWHFALYFSAAKVLQLQFDNYWIPYTLCMLPLLYEAEGHRHWVPDMVVCAALGTLIGNVVYENYHGAASGAGGGGMNRNRAGGPDLPQNRQGLFHPSRWSFGFSPHHGRWIPTVSLRF